VDITLIIFHGIILSLIGTFIILLSLRTNPRLWLQDYPQDIQRKVAPKTKAEKQQSLIWGIPFLITLIAVPFISSLRLKQQSGGAISFFMLFINAFAIGFIFNVVDLLLIDLLIVCAITPKFILIPGTEGASGYKDYRHHFKGFIVGTVLSVTGGLLIAIVVHFL
jgi:hypothetical protein